MTDQLYFSRDTKVFIERNGFFYEIPVLDGFSFSQAHNSSEVTLSEAADTSGGSRRAKQMFNDSFAPTEWSFSTYVRPFVASTGGTKGTLGRTNSEATLDFHHAVEETLWDAFVYNGDVTGTGVTSNVAQLAVEFDQSNTTTVGTFNLYFMLNWNTAGTSMKIYKVADAVVNEASLDFDIEGISTISWSGFGGQLTDEGTTIPFDDEYNNATDLIYEGVGSTNNYIRNKLTTLSLVGLNSAPSTDTYSVVLTGGNVTFSNNITYLTPETIGQVNQPLGHVTGTRSVNGNFTAYLDSDTVSKSTASLFEDIAEGTSVVTTDFRAVFTIGGSTKPKVEIVLEHAHLEIPTFELGDVVSIECNFTGLPSTIEGTDEATVRYLGIGLA